MKMLINFATRITEKSVRLVRKRKERRKKNDKKVWLVFENPVTFATRSRMGECEIRE